MRSTEVRLRPTRHVDSVGLRRSERQVKTANRCTRTQRHGPTDSLLFGSVKLARNGSDKPGGEPAHEGRAHRAPRRRGRAARGPHVRWAAYGGMPTCRQRPATKRIIHLLAGTRLFKNLAADTLAACAARFREVRLGKAKFSFGRGDAGTYLYLLAEGQVRLAIATSEGRELSFQIATAGDLIGEIAVLDGETEKRGSNRADSSNYLRPRTECIS